MCGYTQVVSIDEGAVSLCTCWSFVYPLNSMGEKHSLEVSHSSDCHMIFFPLNSTYNCRLLSIFPMSLVNSASSVIP